MAPEVPTNRALHRCVSLAPTETKLELTQREETPSRLARRKGKRRGRGRTRVQGKTVEEGSKRVVRKRTGQTMEEDTPSMQQKASIQTAANSQSIQGKTAEEVSRRVSRAAKRAQVKVFVEETLKKGVKGLIAEFKSLKRVNDFTKMTEFVAQNAEGRNRYKDVGCLDNDRVIIRIGPVSYIHANYVSSPTNPKRFICTQLPFPFETRIHILVRSLEVSVPGQPLHSCQHYHWQDWPDRGVPDADLAPIVLLSRLKDNTAPIIVHCSAGIGRTGSIVLIQHAMELLHMPAPLLEISTYLIELRKQRNNSIQTEHQYLYIHQVLLLYLKKTKYLDESVTPYLEAFTRDYINATKGF
ncbi:Protein-tyrosine phosphatase [Ostertagia ostertagi]